MGFETGLQSRASRLAAYVEAINSALNGHWAKPSRRRMSCPRCRIGRGSSTSSRNADPVTMKGEGDEDFTTTPRRRSQLTDS